MEARGEDPEIDLKATESAFYQGGDDDRAQEGRIRKISETVIEGKLIFFYHSEKCYHLLIAPAGCIVIRYHIIS